MRCITGGLHLPKSPETLIQAHARRPAQQRFGFGDIEPMRDSQLVRSEASEWWFTVWLQLEQCLDD